MSDSKSLAAVQARYPGRIRNVTPDFIPTELIQRRQWVLWRWQLRSDGRLTTPPYQADGRKAKVNDSATWSSFKDTFESYQQGRGDGVGFVLSADDPFCGIDLDKCRNTETGDIVPWAYIVMKYLASYCEVTPSGTGLRIIVKAKLPEVGRKKDLVEMYDRQRFLTITGQRLPETSKQIVSCQRDIVELHRYVFEPGSVRKPQEKSRRPQKSLSDSLILKKARLAKNGARFTILWDGNWQDSYPSHSEADLALCALLAFWTGGDESQMDRLFRASGLYREKWESPCSANGETYGQKTMAKALNRKQAMMRSKCQKQ